MGMVWRGTGFSLRGETGRIHSVVISFFVVLNMDEPERIFFVGGMFRSGSAKVLIWRVSPVQDGVGGMRGGLGFRFSAGGLSIKYKN